VGFGGFGSSALAMLRRFIQVIAGAMVWLELAVRNAAIYPRGSVLAGGAGRVDLANLAGWTSRLGRLLFCS